MSCLSVLDNVFLLEKTLGICCGSIWYDGENCVYVYHLRIVFRIREMDFCAMDMQGVEMVRTILIGTLCPAFIDILFYIF